MVSFSWKLTAIAALLTLSALVCATATEKLVPMKEIEYVKIFGADEEPSLTKHQDKLYVEFSHRGAYRGKSLPLDNLAEASYVALPLLATEEAMMEPIKCKIKRHRRFFPDKTLFTADVDMRNEDSVMSIVRDLRGRDSGAKIELHMFTTEFIAETVEGVKVEPPKSIDYYFIGLVKALGKLAPKFGVGGTESLTKPVALANPDLPTEIILDGLIEYAKTDEFRPTIWSVILGAPIANRLLPFTNKNNAVQDRVTLRNEIRIYSLMNAVVAPWEGRWTAPLSDDSMHRLCFCNLGMFKIRVVNEMDTYGSDNAYVTDMTFLSNLSYRENFENLGCKVYFNEDANITLIEDIQEDGSGGAVYRPGEPLWAWAKLKARSAIFVEVSLVHLIQYHQIWGNKPSLALRRLLSPEHPFRIALTPHFFATHQACTHSKDLLVAKRGPLGRSLPFDYDQGYKKALKSLVTDFRFKTWPEEMEENGMTGNELHVGATDGAGLHKIMTDYISNLVDEIYPTVEEFEADDDIQKVYTYLFDEIKGIPSESSMANFKLVWSEVLFRVTGVHTSIGNVAITAIEPFFVNFRLDKDNKGVVAGSREVINTVSTITTLTVPNEYPNLNQNWTHVLHDSESKAYNQLKADLIIQGDEVDNRNEGRRFRNRDFHPEIVAISIFS